VRRAPAGRYSFSFRKGEYSDGRALLLEEVVDGAAEAAVDDPVGREGRHRKIAALNLVVALGAGLDALQAMGDGIVDGLIVAGLEVQEGVALQAAPVAAVERVVALEIERATDRAAVGLGHHQHDLVGHGRTQDVEERAREVGRAPFAAAGVHVEGEEGVPVLGLDLVTA
jgi:hypothetical protein